MPKKEESKLSDIEKAAKILHKGGVIIFPTDTVYGIGCKYDEPIGLGRIRHIKGSNQDLPILVADIKQARRLANFSQTAIHLASRFWPGALTLVLNSDKGVKIGLRIPDSDIVKSIIEKAGFPIVGTSANFHGQKAPTTFAQLDKNLIKKVDFVIKGRCKLKLESTVVDTTVDPPKVLRKGGISLQ